MVYSNLQFFEIVCLFKDDFSFTKGLRLQHGFIPWSRKWQPNLVFLPGKSHGQRSLVGHSPCGSQKSPIWLGNWAHSWFHSGLNRTTAQSWVLLMGYLISIHKCGIFQGSWVHLSPDLTCSRRCIFQRLWPASGQWKKWIQSSIYLNQNSECQLPFMWYNMPSPTSLPSNLCSPRVLPVGMNVNLFDFCSDYLYPYQSLIVVAMHVSSSPYLYLDV